MVAGLVVLCNRFRFLSPVQKERWHCEPRPHLGGIAIYIAFAVSMALFGRSDKDLWLVLLCGSAIFILGLLDDLFDLKAHIKFVYQIAIATVAVKMGIVVDAIQDPLLALTISVIWPLRQ